MFPEYISAVRDVVLALNNVSSFSDFEVVSQKIMMALGLAADTALRAALDPFGWLAGGGFADTTSIDSVKLRDAVEQAVPRVRGSTKRKREDPLPEDPRCEDESALPSSKSTFPIKSPQIRPVGKPLLGQLRRKVREMVGANYGIAFPGSQPVSLDKTNLELLEREDYLVSWKADGTRYMMLIWIINQRQRVFMVGRDNTYFEIAYFRFPCLGDWRHRLVDNTLIDGVSLLVFNAWPFMLSFPVLSRV